MKYRFDMTIGQQRLIVTLLLLSVVLGSVFPLSAVATEIYTWTDADGIVHYSDIPQNPQTSVVINVDPAPLPGTSGAYPQDAGSATSGTDPVDNQPNLAEQRRETLAKDRAEYRANKAKLETECARNRELLAKLEPARRVLVPNEEGELVRVNDDQRMEMINQSKDFIAKNCK